MILAMKIPYDPKIIFYQAYEAKIETEYQGRFLLALQEQINIDFWNPLQVGKSATMMVAPNFANVFASALDSAKIKYSVIHEDVQKLIDEMPKMKLHNKNSPDEYHSMDWDDYHDLATMYEYLDYLEGIMKERISIELI